MVRIRLALEEDKKTIARFQVEMAKETENIDLDKEVLSEGVTAVFRDPAKGTDNAKQNTGEQPLRTNRGDYYGG